MTITTGGTGNDVEGKSSAVGDAVADALVGEDPEATGMAAIAELGRRTEPTGTLDSRLEECVTLADDNASDALGVGKTVVYSVLVTIRRDDVVKVVFSGAGRDDTMRLAAALLRAAVP